jgi:hypothetical protein
MRGFAVYSFRAHFTSEGIPPNPNRNPNPNRFLGLAVCRSQRYLHERDWERCCE